MLEQALGMISFKAQISWWKKWKVHESLAYNVLILRA